MRKTIRAFIIIVAIAISGIALHEQSAWADCGGVETMIINCSDDTTDGAPIYAILSIILNVLMIAVGALAVVGIMIAGIQYMTSRDNEQQMAKAKARIWHIMLGLVAYASLHAFLTFLIPGGIQIGDGSSSSETNQANSSTTSSGAAPNSNTTVTTRSSGNNTETNNNTALPDMTDGSEPDAPERGNSPTGDEGWIDRLEE